MKTPGQLRDEIRLREASRADAQREHDAGELSAADLEIIARREDVALEAAHRELATVIARDVVRSSPGTTGTVRRRPRSRLAIALVCFSLAAGVLAWANLALRQAGQSASGGLSLSQTQKVQQLALEGEADVATGEAAAALSAYEQILAIAPTNVEALTEVGWLDFSAGSADHSPAVVAFGVKEVREAVTLAPKSSAPRLYYAIVADATPGNRALAVKEFKVFLSLNPSRAQLAIAAPFLRHLGLGA